MVVPLVLSLLAAPPPVKERGPLEIARHAVRLGDLDGDGALGLAEFEKQLVTNSELAGLVFDALDLDRDGKLDAEPFESLERTKVKSYFKAAVDAILGQGQGSIDDLDGYNLDALKADLKEAMGGDVDMEAVLTNWEKSSGITPAKVREAAKKFLKAVTDADGDDGDPEGGGGQGDETGNGKGGDLKPTKASGAKTFKLNELALANNDFKKALAAAKAYIAKQGQP